MQSINRKPEEQLLIACARGPNAPYTAELVASLVDQPIDWPALIGLAQRHRVMPLVYHSCSTSAGVPSEILAQLRASFMANVGHNRFRTGALLRLLDRLAADGISAISFKGAVLAEELYGTLALRHFGDLDLLVRKDDVERASAILQAEGYQPVFLPSAAQAGAYLRYQHHLVFFHPTSRVVVELHYQLREHYFAYTPDTEQLWRQRRQLPVGGRAVAVLSPEDTLLMLCVHGASHCWERLSWVCDVAAFVRVHPQLDWASIFAQAGQLGGVRMLSLGLRLALGLLGAPLPEPILRHLAGDAALEQLAAQLEQQLFSNNSSSFLQRVRLHLQARERWRDRVRYCLRLALTPTEGDWSLIALPKRLTFFYYVLRPFRLAAIYSRVQLQAAQRSVSGST